MANIQQKFFQANKKTQGLCDYFQFYVPFQKYTLTFLFIFIFLVKEIACLADTQILIFTVHSSLAWLSIALYCLIMHVIHN